MKTYVTWGYPNVRSVWELILKHGQAKVKSKIIPLTDSTVIEEHLEKFSVICLEQVILEIVFLEKNFQVISGFLCPFLFSLAYQATKIEYSSSRIWAHWAIEVNASVNSSDG